MGLLDLVALQTHARETDDPVVVRFELAAVPVLPDPFPGNELEAVGDVGQPRLFDRELGDREVGVLRRLGAARVPVQLR